MGLLGKIAERTGIMEKQKPLHTVVVRVKMDCQGCERKVHKALSSLNGAHSVMVDRKQQRAEVTGYVDEKDVLRRLRAVGKRGEIWPYVPASLVPYPCAPGAYDRKAPPGQVLKVDAAVAPQGPIFAQGQAISQAFSDDNPNGCSIM